MKLDPHLKVLGSVETVGFLCCTQISKNVVSNDLSLMPFIFNLIPVEDLERNDGSPERPYLMPESLRKVLNKKNKTQLAQ